MTTIKQPYPRVTNRFIEHDGKRLTVTELAKQVGIPRNTIYTRLSREQHWQGKKGAKLY